MAQKKKSPVIVAMVGLVGSGKSTIAKELAVRGNAAIIEANALRVELRTQGKKFDAVHKMAEAAVIVALQEGKNVVIDSDHTDGDKRKRLAAIAKKHTARVMFVRVVCDPDVMVGRMIEASHGDPETDLFTGASTQWKGTNRGNVVKIREMWRRTPHHYQWEAKNGGQWKLKKFSFPLASTIDTTDANAWPTAVEKCAAKIFK